MITDPVMTNGGDNSLWADITTKAQAEIRVMIVNIINIALIMYILNKTVRIIRYGVPPPQLI